MASRRRLVVLSGGSAANNLIDVFTTLCQDNGRGLDFIIPISDNGGSTSEILRVFGGPGIGDVRSRLVRLVPEETENSELQAIKRLLGHRLASCRQEARMEWLEIVEGTHKLWTGISSEKRELLRSFFNLLNLEILKRSRPGSSFNFSTASTGNLFLTGARIFFGSFESAIYLFRSITGVPDNIQVIPAINSNFAHHIAAGLEDGTVITGQNQISHPSPPASGIPQVFFPPITPVTPSDSEAEEEEIEDANLPGSLAELRKQNIAFSKHDEAELTSRIERVWYINPYGQEIRPPANPKAISSLNHAEAVIYSIGSLYTSLAPILVLKNIAQAIKGCPSHTPKILLLNGSHDRETSPDCASFTGTSFVKAIVRAITGDADTARWRDYVTHVIFLEGNGAPKVNTDELKARGVEPVRVYGRRHPDGEGKGMLYDSVPLLSALGAILGKARGRKPETRRNTVDGLQLANGAEKNGNGHGLGNVHGLGNARTVNGAGR